MKLNFLFTTLAAIFFLSSLVAAQTNKIKTSNLSYVVAVCRDANTVEILDGETLKSAGRIPVGEAPHEAVSSADGRIAYVANYGTKDVLGNSISVIDLAARREIRRIDLGELKRPHGLQIVNGKLYFTAETNKAVARLDLATEKIDWQAKTDQIGSHMLAVSADGKKVYTANIGSSSVTAIETNGGETKVTQISVGKEPEGITLSPDGKTLWIGHRKDGLISVIDLAAQKVVQTLNAGQMPLRLSYAPDGKRVFAINPHEGAVMVFDAATRKEAGRISIDGAPVGLAFSRDGSRAFITDLKNGKVVSLDAQKLTIINSAAVDTLSDGIGLAETAKK